MMTFTYMMEVETNVQVCVLCFIKNRNARDEWVRVFNSKLAGDKKEVYSSAKGEHGLCAAALLDTLIRY